ncbi:unnamed protein product [Mycena citricolor]|uniref:Uncharacterized protein n=1 Tax=Mycena citricolor TaxID=2018698 RepID=A0AAD2HEY3_9AGAR|nr:unnamed protein product [Mycena citricolor]
MRSQSRRHDHHCASSACLVTVAVNGITSVDLLIANSSSPEKSSSAMANATQQPVSVTITLEEEDRIVNARIMNDDKPIKRVIKKFHNYTQISHPPPFPIITVASPGSAATQSATPLEDAREAFLLELTSFELMLRKSVMICEAEARQVDEYERETRRINDEHGTLRGQIEQLKTALEQEQLMRKRKMEYEFVAEKVNTLPSREELELSIKSLENDMATIRDEHERQNRAIHTQKAALDAIVTDLNALRSLGPESAAMNEIPPEDAEVPDVEPAKMEISTSMDVEEAGSEPVEPKGDDIEMGEVEEPPEIKAHHRSKQRLEEREEGEASDPESSDLSEPPDDI